MSDNGVSKRNPGPEVTIGNGYEQKDVLFLSLTVSAYLFMKLDRGTSGDNSAIWIS